MQVGHELRPFVTETGSKIAFLHEGKQHPIDMFNKEHSTVSMESWIYRCAAYLFAIFGTYMASRIIAYISK